MKATKIGSGRPAMLAAAAGGGVGKTAKTARRARRAQAGKSTGGGKKVEQVALRLDGELLELVDAEVAKRQAERPWDKITRVDVLREALWRLLKAPTK